MDLALYVAETCKIGKFEIFRIKGFEERSACFRKEAN